MALKWILSLGFIAVASAVAVPVSYHGPALVKAVAPIYKSVEYDAPAHYDFAYSVHDDHTGDIKSQTESRKGDAVHGSYSLIDSDGFQRTVEYTADDHNGFNAVVHREPTAIKIPVPVVAKVVAPYAKVLSPAYHAAPAVHYAAPAVHYSAPAVHYAAPAAHYAAPALHYSAPIAKVAAYAPAKLVAPVAHGYAPAQVSFSGPAASYHY